MKKKILLLFAVLASAINALAYDFQVDGIYYNTLSNQDMTCEITYQNCENGSHSSPYYGDFVIPNSVIFNGKTFIVSGIGKWAFHGCRSLKSVEIPNSVTSIGNYAFLNCMKLKSITIPNSVTFIGDEAFEDCSALTSIIIPNSVTSIGSDAFQGCIALTSFEIPNSITLVEPGTLSKCMSLESVTIPNSVHTIRDYAFLDCTSLKVINSLAVIPPYIYSSTFEGVPKINLMLIVPNESVAAYQAADYWNNFWNIIGIDSVGEDTPITQQCAEPMIELVNGELVATSTTEGAICYTSITSEDFKGVDGNDPIELTGIYNISSYAHSDGYLNSETVTAKLVWVNPNLEGAGVLCMETKKAVLICVQGGDILVSGTERGETIQIYTIDGLLYCTVSADEYQTVIPCNLNKGEVVIVSYGGKSVKIVL